MQHATLHLFTSGQPALIISLSLSLFPFLSYLLHNSISQNTGIRAVDLGMPQLSMHSIREMMGVSDLTFAHRLFTTFFKDFRTLDSSLKNVDSGP
jgi:Aminopeptidase I zinc metalloprotease (M18)